MSAPTLSPDCYALLGELQLQRAASTRYLQEQLPLGQVLIDRLTALHDLGLIRQRGEQLWSLSAEGCLALEDWACVRVATQPLQILMGSNQFYIKGGTEGSGKPDINTRVINLIQEYNKRTR